MNTPTVERGISDLVGCPSIPIIVFPGGWDDTLPEWLKNAITLERLAMNMRVLKGELPTGTDAEACAYLNTASLTQPMDHDWTQIYPYIAGKTYTRCKKAEMPEDIRVESLNDDQMRALNRLKAWLYQKRTTAWLERERAERRQKKRTRQPGERQSNQHYLTSSILLAVYDQRVGGKTPTPLFYPFQGVASSFLSKNLLKSTICFNC